MLMRLFQGAVISFVLALANLVLMARLLPIEFVGVIKQVQLFSAVFSVLGTLQIHSGLLAFKNDLNSSELIDAVLQLCLFVIVFSFVPVILVSFKNPGIEAYGLLGVYLYTFTNALVVASPSIFTVFEKGRSYVLFTVLFMFSATVSILFAYKFNLTVGEYLAIWGGGAAVAVVISHWRILICKVCKRLCELRAIPVSKNIYFQYSIKLSFSIVTENIYQKVDKLYASSIMSSSMFGRYSVVCFENPLVGMVLSTMGVSLVGESQEAFKKNTVNFFSSPWREKVEISMLLIISSSLFLMCFSRELISFVFGEDFSEYSSVFFIYCSVGLFRFAPFQVLLRLSGRSDLIFYSAALSLCVVTVLCSVYVWLGETRMECLAAIYFIGWLIFNSAVVLICVFKYKYDIFSILCFWRYMETIVVFVLAVLILKLISDLFGLHLIVVLFLYGVIFMGFSLSRCKESFKKVFSY